MFRDLFGGPKPQPESKAQPVAPAPRPVPARVSDTVLGLSSNLKGNLKTEGNVRIEGTFKGNITAQGNVTIGEQGKVDGNISGKIVEVSGMVTGDVIAGRVSVRGTGRVRGNLRLEKLMTEEGAFIQGLVTMEEKIVLPEAVSDVPSTGDIPTPAPAVEKITEMAKATKAPVSKN